MTINSLEEQEIPQSLFRDTDNQKGEDKSTDTAILNDKQSHLFAELLLIMEQRPPLTSVKLKRNTNTCAEVGFIVRKDDKYVETLSHR